MEAKYSPLMVACVTGMCGVRSNVTCLIPGFWLSKTDHVSLWTRGKCAGMREELIGSDGRIGVGV